MDTDLPDPIQGTPVPIARLLVGVHAPLAAESGLKLNEALREVAEEAFAESLDGVLSAYPAGTFKPMCHIDRSFSGSWWIEATMNLWSGLHFSYEAVAVVATLATAADAIDSAIKKVRERFPTKAAAMGLGTATTVSGAAMSPPVQGTSDIAAMESAFKSVLPGKSWVIPHFRGGGRHIEGRVVAVTASTVTLETEDRKPAVYLLSAIVGFESRPGP
ncbi:hypothetical protein QTH90_21605 [Variovorax sp. J2P1-59]|uniref:hypothetical protein n=1 Tax=Variovorax flavidus TaxID=3053501 RepID=UPI0025784D0F|nr:hypothetical protein [Variovorax sp. J2P1-59]MDM0077021.1 hypothetical protein [Variovorax sp. J2P1-59]